MCNGPRHCMFVCVTRIGFQIVLILVVCRERRLVCLSTTLYRKPSFTILLAVRPSCFCVAWRRTGVRGSARCASGQGSVELPKRHMLYSRRKATSRLGPARVVGLSVRPHHTNGMVATTRVKFMHREGEGNTRTPVPRLVHTWCRWSRGILCTLPANTTRRIR